MRGVCELSLNKDYLKGIRDTLKLVVDLMNSYPLLSLHEFKERLKDQYELEDI